jgi:DNA-directed RNA polymerase subunit RPC12/RpoP
VQRPEKQGIIQYFRTEHNRRGKTPSIRDVCKNLGLDSKRLYELFPGRKAEMCAAAGVPLDADSFKQVAKASQALREKMEKEVLEDDALRSLRETEEEIGKELGQVKTINESRERVKELERSLAGTSEGRKQIFFNPQRLLEFSARMIDYESFALSSPNVWDSFVAFCKTDGLDLAGKLFEVSGPREEYEEHVDEDELDNYLGFKLEGFLLDHEKEQRQKEMQTKFEGVLRNFRCSECGRDIKTTYLIDSALCCPCGRSRTLLCLNCKQELRFDPKMDALTCHACGMSFRFVVG